jgi:hypothetical protein
VEASRDLMGALRWHVCIAVGRSAHVAQEVVALAERLATKLADCLSPLHGASRELGAHLQICYVGGGIKDR